MVSPIIKALAGLTIATSLALLYRMVNWQAGELRDARADIRLLRTRLEFERHRREALETTRAPFTRAPPSTATPAACNCPAAAAAGCGARASGASPAGGAAVAAEAAGPDGRPVMMASIRGDAAERVGVEFSLFGTLKPAEVLPKRTSVFIACITSQSPKGANQRERIRKTWMKQIKTEYQPTEIDTLFFVGTFSPKAPRKSRKDRIPAVTPDVLKEQQEHGDIVVVDAPDTYEGLINKVRTVMQWVIADRNVDFVAKFDDDCYVNVRTLLKEVAKLPSKERVYFGQMLAGGKVLRTSRNAEKNLPRSMDWYPPYASGAGYMLSADLVKAIAFPAVRLLDMVNEDAHLGIVLLPFDVKRVSTHKIAAYGLSACTDLDDVIAVHYVKDKTTHDCMVELHENATSGKQVCKSRYCGPVVCEEEFPRRAKKCEVKEPKWEVIQAGKWRMRYPGVWCGDHTPH